MYQSLSPLSNKILEHIVASNLAKHFSELDIFYKMHHGFQENRSCEMQLIMLIDELAKILRWANSLIVLFWTLVKLLIKLSTKNSSYEGQSKISEPDLITFELSKMDIYLDDISLKLYVIYLIT